jgi:hypothetical protein
LLFGVCPIDFIFCPALCEFFLRKNHAHRVAADKGSFWYIFMDECSSGDDGAVTDPDAGHERGIGSDHDFAANFDVAEAVFLDQVFVGQDCRVVANDGIAANRDFFREHDVKHDHQRKRGLVADLHSQECAVQPVFHAKKWRVASQLDDDEIFDDLPERDGFIHMPE